MKRALLPLMLLCLSGCGTVHRMNALVNDSTDSIDANRQAVERSTSVIRQNQQLIDASTRTLQENRKHLEGLHK